MDKIDATLSITTKVFAEAFLEESLQLGVLGLTMTNNIRKQLEKKLRERLNPIVKNLFTSGFSDSNKIVGKEVSKLVDDIGIPYKYNKDLFTKFNDKNSIFMGYGDKAYKDLFTKREIDAIKRTILSGKYNGWTDKQLQAAIRNTVKITKNRALNLARNESARLGSMAAQMYYEKPAVQKEYDKVYKSETDGKVRPAHLSFNGKIADKDGYFHSSYGSVNQVPNPIGGHWNCRCEIYLRKKP